MPKGAGPMSGPRPATPKAGKNGPGDGGKHAGTRHSNAKRPMGGKLPIMTGTRTTPRKGGK